MDETVLVKEEWSSPHLSVIRLDKTAKLASGGDDGAGGFDLTALSVDE
ncbi:MAG: hypothetical protein MUF84_18915 [Anaerolineae bacterium]|jgi:hypothetical protein|nr:hypothetical protein [Anaerolineae bacterium]